MAKISFNSSHPDYIEDLKKIEGAVPWQELRGKCIAVTGSTGLLGSLIIDFLLYLNKEHNAKIQVFALGRNVGRLKTGLKLCKRFMKK